MNNALKALWHRCQRRAKTRNQDMEIRFLAGLIAKAGLLRPLIGSLSPADGQDLLKRAGVYIRNELEQQLGYDEMETVLRVAGMGSASHLAPDWCEARIMVTDKLDYGRNLTPRERLADRALRFDNVLRAILLHGFEAMRETPEPVLRDIQAHRHTITLIKHGEVHE